MSGAPPPPPKPPEGTRRYLGNAMVGFAWDLGIPIGSTGDDSGGKASTPQIVTVSGGAAGAAGAAGATADTAAANSSTSSKASKAKKKAAASKAKVSGANSIDATAKKNGVKLPPKVVKIGQKCEKGAKGCQGGKFTGNFFGGG